MLSHDYEHLLHAHGLVPAERGVWAVVGHATGDFGWKLHLSSIQADAPALLRAVLPILARHGVPFKIARDSDLLGMLNEGTLGSTQIGKFATVYPGTPRLGVDLAAELIAATQAFRGPRIVTDLHLGAVVYARYGSFNPRMVRDRLGQYAPSDGNHQGGYRVPFALPEGIDNPFAAYVAERRATPAAPAPIGPGYLIVDVLQTHAKGSVFKAIDLRDRESVATVVLKEGRRHCMSDMHGRDMWDRLRNQAAAHGALAGKAPVPSAGPLFEHGGSLYLPLDHVDGRDFGARPATPYGRLTPSDRRRLLSELVEIAAAIRDLHGQGYVHRDLSMRNIRVTADGCIALLDLEISQRVGDGSVPPLLQGTPGFVSPRQLAGELPSFGDDVYAFGAVMLCALTGLDPQRVLYARPADRARQIRILSGAPESLCRLTAACVSIDEVERPDWGAIRSDLVAASAETQPTGASVPEPAPRDYRPIVDAGLRWLVLGAPRDEQSQMWRSPDLDSSEHGSLKLVHGYRVYRSTNRGVAGVVYTLAKLHRFGFGTLGAADEIGAAVDWLLDHQPTPDDQMVGLHFGEAGVAVAMAEAIATGLIERGPWLSPYMREALSGPLDWPDLTHGAAGQGLAALACSDLLGDGALAELAGRCADHLVAAQRPDGSWVLPSGVPAMAGATYSGFAHGVAGIVAFLATYARRASSSAAREAAERGGQWLLDQARPGRGGLYLWWPMRIDEEQAWTWWCHGAPGIALGLLALYKLTGDDRYVGAVRACLRAQPFEVRHANMSQCHGLSGLGEILLEAHRVLDEPEWLDRAQAIGRVLACLAREAPDGASWLVENPYQPTPDLMIGSGGVVHFLARLTHGPDPAFRLPLMPGED